MSTTSSTADRSSKRKRIGDVGSGDRRSSRRVSGDSVTSSSKLTDEQILGSVLAERNKYITRKENNKTLEVTFTCNDTNKVFDSFAAAGKHFLEHEHEQKVQWMEEGLADDKLFQATLISLARGGHRDAIRICKEYDIAIEEEEEEGVGMPVKSTKKEDDEVVDLVSSEEEEEEENAKAGATKGEVVEGKQKSENTVVNANAGTGAGAQENCKVRTYYIYIYIIYIYIIYYHLTQRVLCILIFYTQGVGCSW